MLPRQQPNAHIEADVSPYYTKQSVDGLSRSTEPKFMNVNLRTSTKNPQSTHTVLTMPNELPEMARAKTNPA